MLKTAFYSLLAFAQEKSYLICSGNSCKMNFRLKDAARIGSVKTVTSDTLDRARFRSEI